MPQPAGFTKHLSSRALAVQLLEIRLKRVFGVLDMIRFLKVTRNVSFLFEYLLSVPMIYQYPYFTKFTDVYMFVKPDVYMLIKLNHENNMQVSLLHQVLKMVLLVTA